MLDYWPSALVVEYVSPVHLEMGPAAHTVGEEELVIVAFMTQGGHQLAPLLVVGRDGGVGGGEDPTKERQPQDDALQ